MPPISPFVRAIALTAILAAPVRATADPAPAPASPAPPDLTGLEATVDESFRSKMARYRVSGGVVVVVHRGEVVLSKGYGLADVARDVPVDASRTLFRLGSIAKPVTAMAALGLVAEGALPFDEDLPSAIGVAVPRRFDRPVTLRHLLTHTAGFEPTDIGDAARRPEAVAPLETVVSSRMPAQHWLPGTTHVYSNHGFTLAGLAVQRAAGRPFAAAVARRVFEPLGMHRSSFGPLPEALAGDLARGHEPAGRGYRPLPMDGSNVAPADMLMSTGDDMGRWMRALLGGGVLEGRQVLDPVVAGMMLTPQFAYVGSRPVSGLGLLFEHHRGYWAPAHTGGQLGFSSHMVLFLEHELGILIALNTRAGRMRWEVLRDVLERHLPMNAPARPLAGGTDPGTAPRRLAGRYRRADFPRSTFEKARALAPAFPELRVTATGETLHLDGKALEPLGGDRYWLPETGREVRFEVDDAGRGLRLLGGSAWERVPWWASKRLHAVLLGGALVVFAGALLGAALVAVRRRRRRESSAGGRRARVLLLTAATYLVGMLAFLAQAESMLTASDYGVALPGRLALWTLDLGALLSLAAVPAAIALGTERGQPRRRRLAALALGFFAVVTTASLAYWRVIG